MLFPVKQLLDGKDPPLCIQPEVKVRDALRDMMENDFSQLPIVDLENNLLGIITEHTIVNRYLNTNGKVNLLDLKVVNCQTEPRTISAESDIFEALDLLKSDYAIVVTENRKAIGILTSFDSTNFFRDLSEGLILIEDIEISLRHHIKAALPDEKVLDAALFRTFNADRKDPTRPAKEYDSLSLYDHVQLIANSENWKYFSKVFESKEMFSSLMNEVCRVRNQLVHFRGRLEPIQKKALHGARDWLASHSQFPESDETDTRIVDASMHKLLKERVKGRYDYLQKWLEQETGDTKIRIAFAEIEKILDVSLPRSAREHQSWWSNDYSTHSQARAWLNSGWLVDNVDLNNNQVTFRKSVTAYYPPFFADLLSKLKERDKNITDIRKAQLQNWLSFSAGISGFQYGWVLPRQPVLRVELYIDTGNRERNLSAFDTLFTFRDEIEQGESYNLFWDKIEGKRACRIYTTKEFHIGTANTHETLGIKEWGVDTMLNFVSTFQPFLEKLD